MTQFIRGLIFWPLVALFVLIAVANRQTVTFSLDPFNPVAPALSLDVPVFAVLLLGGLAGVLFGGLSAWADQAHWRRAARNYKKQLQALQAAHGIEAGPALPAKPKPIL